jgi:dTDP-4-amino-4,6-dideoxygalactose transaminase
MKALTVPFFSLHEQTQSIKTACLSVISNLLDTQQFIGGPSIAALEKELAQYLKVKHVISCNSGTDALWLAIHALDVKPNDIVLTTPFSFIASASELIPHGAHPVFIDVEPSSYTIDPAQLRLWLETNTHQEPARILRDDATHLTAPLALSNVEGSRADTNSHSKSRTIHTATGFPVVGLIPVHLFGQCADMTALLAIAKEFNLWTIEDTAQAIGSTLNHHYAGTMGDIGTFSFYPTKNLGAFGDAGCMVTNDDALAARLVRLRNHGRKNHYEYECYGLNSRLDAMQAEILRIKLQLVDSYNARRRSIAARYDAAFKNVPYLKIPAQVHGVHTYHQYSVVIKPEVCGMVRDAVIERLELFGIGTRVFYPQPLPAIDYLRTSEALTTQTPITDYLIQNIMALPIWPEMSDAQVEHVAMTLSSLPVVDVHGVTARV